MDFWWNQVLYCRPPTICFLYAEQSGPMVIRVDVSVGSEISPNLRNFQDPAKSIWFVKKTGRTNFSSSRPPWIHPRGCLTTCDIYWEGSLTQDQCSQSHGHQKNPTNWSVTLIFFELQPSENSGTVKWNKRPLLFI